MENELIVVETKDIETVFKAGGCDPLLKRIKEEVAKFEPDISTVKGRKEIASLANKVAKSKTYVDGLGKDLVATIKAKTSIIDGERKKLRDTLDALKAEVRKPLTDWEDAEKKRVADIEQRIHTIEDFINIQLALIVTAEDAKAALDKVNAIVVDESFEEFELAATKAKSAAVTQFEAKFIVLQNQEKEAAETKRLEEERFEKERIEREETLKKEAADKATKEAEEKAKVEQDEKDRLAKEEIEKANREKLEAELATKRAEDEKREAAEKAERDKEQAIEDERKRVDDEKKQAEADDLKRQENKRHRAKILKEARQDAIAYGIDEASAGAFLGAIVAGEIRHIKIQF